MLAGRSIFRFVTSSPLLQLGPAVDAMTPAPIDQLSQDLGGRPRIGEGGSADLDRVSTSSDELGRVFAGHHATDPNNGGERKGAAALVHRTHRNGMERRS